MVSIPGTARVRRSQGLRGLVKDLLPPAALRLYRKAKMGRYYGLQKLDRKLEKYLDYNGGFYVELGANDGITQSNTAYFERRRNWKGVLIEPSHRNFLKCRQNRAATNAFYCAACVSFDYADPFVRIAYSNLCSTPMGLESDVRDPLQKAIEGIQHLEADEDVFVFEAEAKTLHELLVSAEAPRQIDLLSLDVEGAELEVLKGLDHQHFRFRYMLIEARDLPKLESYLADKQYRCIDQLSFHDYLFADEAAPANGRR